MTAATALPDHTAFLALVLALETRARFRFRFRSPADREDAVADVVAHGFSAFGRLRRRGMQPAAFPGAFAKFVVLEVAKGLRVGGRVSGRDVLSETHRRRGRFVVRRMDDSTPDGHAWWRDLAADRRIDVADQAAFNLDFPAWLSNLTVTKRRIAELLAYGHSGDVTARLVGVTPGRVSQVRRELAAAWHAFHETSERRRRRS